MNKNVFIFCMFLTLMTSASKAELSSNPWLEQNSEEDLQEVYTKRQKRANLKNGITNYTPEDEVIIDRSHAYVELPKEEDTPKEDKGFLDKLLSSDDQSEAPLMTKTEAKNRAKRQKAHNLATPHTETNSSSNSGILSGLGLDSSIAKIKNAVKLPSGTGLIQKFERASGIDLKAIGRQMHR